MPKINSINIRRGLGLHVSTNETEWLDIKSPFGDVSCADKYLRLAFYIKQLKDTGKPVNVMTLNPNATGIHLTDVIQGLNDTFRQVPGLICGHCRPENASATVQKV
ncbi:hypothetical protein DQY66_22020 [Salmonella enterica subsp. enterica serovar Utah]|uniref:hypothetical protein n=1 Tax=Salmonella enterica TaxID=28901 RepID=UPI000DEC1391|nr:hypothetical protein [Salmonella enterica]EBX0575668.1 hypothetical protein [Salmonella enterica subsp. enterica serovar Utah]EEA6506660.1 hypothetical protein [Salmonella enterica subsp. enterica serovar Reading]EIC3513042.1 hypothetical protein [Salmonella enterica subsp. enterica serovar Oranienburg]AXD36038.1 hypothetical protein CHD15_25370 [Salmonella enterica]EEC0579072.1 hypothetical protein [Salmonella enterica]